MGEILKWYGSHEPNDNIFSDYVRYFSTYWICYIYGDKNLWKHLAQALRGSGSVKRWKKGLGIVRDRGRTDKVFSCLFSFTCKAIFITWQLTLTLKQFECLDIFILFTWTWRNLLLEKQQSYLITSVFSLKLIAPEGFSKKWHFAKKNQFWLKVWSYCFFWHSMIVSLQKNMIHVFGIRILCYTWSGD